MSSLIEDTCTDNGVFAENAASIDSVFGEYMWPGVNTVGLNWHVKLQDASMGRRETCHKICFRHGQMKGSYVLLVDGVAQITNGFQPVTARQPVRVEFKMDGKNCCIVFDGMRSLISYVHNLFIEGVRFPEARETIDIGTNERMPTSVATCGIKIVAGVVYFGLNVSFGSDESTKVTIYRRYSQFVMLDSLIRAQLDFHLISSMPSLPGKVYNPYFNQLSKAFLAERHDGVCNYLNQLLGNSKVCCVLLSNIGSANSFIFVGLSLQRLLLFLRSRPCDWTTKVADGQLLI